MRVKKISKHEPRRMLFLTADIVWQWWAEKRGIADTWGILLAIFYGDSRESYFRKRFKSATAWDLLLSATYVGR